MRINQLPRKEIKRRFVKHINAIKRVVSMANAARWFQVQCLLCGKFHEGNPKFIKMMWMDKGCPSCHSNLGYRLIEMSFYDRQRTYYRNQETNELEKAPITDLAYKISKKQREKTGNISYQADLKKDGLLRRPTRNRTNKILDMKAQASSAEKMKKMKERILERRRRY